MRRTPIKGEPDFSPYTDEQVREMRVVVERLRGAFLHDPEICKSFDTALRSLTVECAERTSNKPETPKETAILKKRSVKFNKVLKR